MFRSAVAVVAAMSVCGVAPAGFADAPPTGVRAAMVPLAAPKAQKAKLDAPSRVKEVGTTVLLKKPTYTNAGRRIRVTVKTQRRHGGRTTPRDVKVIRKNGKVALRVSGLSWIRAEVHYRAKKAPAYAAFSKQRVYKSWQPQAEADLPMTGPSAAGLEWKDLLSGLISSVAEDVTGSGAIGWAVGFLFSLSQDPKPDPMEELKKQLDVISGQLKEINEKLDQLSAQSAFETCSVMTGMTTDAVATIRTQADQYRQYTNPKSPNKSHKDWIRWADEVLNTGNGSLQRLTYIRTQLADQPNKTNGALHQCAEAFRKAWEGGAALNEDKYYSEVWTFLNYFYQMQLLGLNNVVEAYHVRAADEWMNGDTKPKPLPEPKDMKKICKDTVQTKPGASPSQNCDYARDATEAVYWAMIDQAKAAGAAYAWNVDARKSIAMQVNTPLLWVTDLNKYGDRSNCNGPVNSVYPCGRTVGKAEPLGLTTGLGYDGWKIASSRQWQNLLGSRSKANTTGEAMRNAGFPESMQSSIIVYTGETVSHDSSSMRWLSGIQREEWNPLKGDWGAFCMLDTNLGRNPDDRATWVFCHDGAAMWFLADNFSSDGAGCYPTYHYYKSDVAKGGTSSRFYDVDLVGVHQTTCEGRDSDYFEPEVIKAPGWMTRGEPTGVAQYRWPVQDISTRQCTNFRWGRDQRTLSQKNVAGTYTMCGEDFRAWMKTQMPDPPRAHR